MMAVYMFSSPEELVCSQGIPTGVCGWDTGINWGREIEGEGLCDTLEIGSGKKGKPHLVFCYQAGMRLGGLVLGVSMRNMCLLWGSLLPYEEWPFGCQGIPAKVGLWDKDTVVGRSLLGEDLWNLWEMGWGGGHDS